MINVRAELEKAWQRPVPDPLWDYLEEQGFADEAEHDLLTIEGLLEEARRVIAAGRREMPETAGNEVARQLAGAAATARIDALSAIFAAWASGDLEVQRFRERVLAGDLLVWDDAGPWILAQRAADAPDGDADSYLLAAFTRSRPDAPPPFTTLWYVSGRERTVSVDTQSVLGDLAQLADKLSSRYRWRPSGGTMFLLTGKVPEVFVYTGSASVRGGGLVATARVTMTLDPALTPEQVAGIYARLRARIHPSPQPRPLSVKHYRLAEHVGPRVAFGLNQPSAITRPGRRPRVDPDGLVRTITPVTGWTWNSLREAWNDKCGTRPTADGRTWRYDTSHNFIRDAKHALTRLLAPGWQWQGDTGTTNQG
jgi:hypothetical protein